MTYVTYHSTNAPQGEQWCAYLTKFKVFCFGATEEAAKERAQAFYERQRARAVETPIIDKGVDIEAMRRYLSTSNPDENKISRGHANIGKVWMHKEGIGFARVVITEIAMYEKNGYVRKGPRSAM